MAVKVDVAFIFVPDEDLVLRYTSASGNGKYEGTS